MLPVHVELWLRVYLLGRKLKAETQDQNADKLSSLAMLTLLLKQNESVTRLGEKLCVKASAMSDRVKKMEEVGWVRGSRGEDGREKMIKITSEGQREWRKLVREMHGLCRGVDGQKDVVSPNEVKTALNILNKLCI